MAGAYICGLPESKIERLTFENVEISYAADAKSGVAAMMLACKESCRSGIIVSNIKELILDNVGSNLDQKAWVRSIDNAS